MVIFYFFFRNLGSLGERGNTHDSYLSFKTRHHRQKPEAGSAYSSVKKVGGDEGVADEGGDETMLTA